MKVPHLTRVSFRAISRWPFSALLLLCLASCDGSVSTPENPPYQPPITSDPLPVQGSGIDSTAPAQPPPDLTPASKPPLDETHQGWKQRNCKQCHNIPQPNHKVPSGVSGTAYCAACHGGNGACNPNAKQPHDETMNCTASSCHGRKHSYSKKLDCIYCHIVATATVACP